MRIDPAIWKFGSWIAAIRLVALWSQVIGFSYGDWRQLPGYFLSLFILPELYVVRDLRNDQPRWVAHLALLIFFSSYLYAGILVWVRRRTNKDN
jgi:hypothetical protein